MRRSDRDNVEAERVKGFSEPSPPNVIIAPRSRTAKDSDVQEEITRPGAEVDAPLRAGVEASDAVLADVQVIFRNCEVRELEY
jgi:hypothetical protein